MNDPELDERWNRTKALDRLVADIAAGRDAEVLQKFGEFGDKPSVFVGVMSRMLQTRRPTLVTAVANRVKQDPTLGVRRHSGRTLLHFAAGEGCTEIVVLMLSLGVDANVLDGRNHPPLYSLANECGADTGPEIVRILAKAGADVNHRGGVTSATPLHMAARRGYVGIAEALLDSGADPGALDTKGCTPLDRAVNCRKEEVAQLLRRRIG